MMVLVFSPFRWKLYERDLHFERVLGFRAMRLLIYSRSKSGRKNRRMTTTTKKGVVKMVVFDMAGTTVHDEDFVNLCFQQAMKNGADLTVTRAEINDVMGMRKPD